MPTYDFGCFECRVVFEKTVSFKEKNAPLACPNCGKMCYRMPCVLSSGNIVSDVISDQDLGDRPSDYRSTKRRISDGVNEEKKALIEMRRERTEEQLNLEQEIDAI